MQLGMIGLGRMGANMVRRLMKDGHACLVYDMSANAVAALAKEGATGATSLADLKSLKIGTSVGSTSYTAAVATFGADTVQVFNTNDEVVAALQAGQIDALVIDLPSAFYLRDAVLDGGKILGQLADSTEGGDQYGLLLAKDSALTAPVTAAVDALQASGALAQVLADWTTIVGPAIAAVTTPRRLSAGTLTIDTSAGNAFAGAFNLTIGGASNTVVNDPIATGAGTFTKDGAGTVTLAGTNTYTGLTTVSVGVLNLHGDEVGFFTSELTALLNEMADNISYALTNMKREAERDEAQKALVASEQKFQQLTANIRYRGRSQEHEKSATSPKLS